MYAADLLSQLGSITVLLFPLVVHLFCGADRVFYARLPKFFVLNASPARITCKSRGGCGPSVGHETNDPAESLHTMRQSRVSPSRRIKRRDAVRVH